MTILTLFDIIVLLNSLFTSVISSSPLAEGLICFAIFSSILLSSGCSNNQNTPIEEITETTMVSATETKNDNDIIEE